LAVVRRYATLRRPSIRQEGLIQSTEFDPVALTTMHKRADVERAARLALNELQPIDDATLEVG
jgi:hypothetical protein